MKRRPFVFAVLFAALVGAACGTRHDECEKFLSAVRPMDEGNPSADLADRVSKELDGLDLKDQPLREYRDNYRRRLGVLSSSLRLKASTANPPDGTDDLIKQKVIECRNVRADVKKYCDS